MLEGKIVGKTVDYIILCEQYPKASTKKLELVNKFSKVAGNKINI